MWLPQNYLVLISGCCLMLTATAQVLIIPAAVHAKEEPQKEEAE